LVRDQRNNHDNSREEFEMFLTVRVRRLCLMTVIASSAVALKPVVSFAWDDGADSDAPANSGGEATDAVPQGIEFLNADLAQGALISNGRLWLIAGRESSIGVDVTPMSAVLRSQLGLTDDRGVVVTNVAAEGPAAEAGIQVHDVLLSAGGKPVKDAAALQEQIVAAVEEAIPIILMRGGKRMSVEVTPRGPDSVWVDSPRRNYWIGITAADADDALRSQLGIPEGQGLVVTEVYDESAAAAAGIEVHDVVLEFENSPLSSVEELNSRIQEVGEQPATVKLIRGGDELTLKVTPRVRDGGDGMLWVYDTSQSLRNLAELTAQYSGVNAYNLPANQPFYTLNGLGSGEVNLDFYNQAGGSVGGFDFYPGRPRTETIEQKLQGLIEESRDLTDRMRALQESLRQPSDSSEEADPPAESSEGGENGADQE
jgi:PDZ domain